MNIEKLDRVTLSEEDYHKLFDWKENHKEYVRNFKPVMKQGLIVIGDKQEQTFEEDSLGYIYKLYLDGVVCHEVKWLKSNKFGYVLSSKAEKSYQQGLTEDMITLHATLMAYMEYYSDMKEYVEVEDVKVIKKKKDKKGKVKSKKTVKIGKRIYKIRVTNESVVRDKRRYERSMEKWSVRGHWRTTKTGKKVWIKPHYKGEGEVKPKDYRI